MKDYKEVLSNRIKNGGAVALYCYGVLADHMLHSLEKFYNVLPTVVIDNDERKRGTAEFGVPVMPFADARERYDNLQYFICSDDFKYTIIGDLLEKGVQPEDILNYVPVEKRKTCLYFYNRLLLAQGVENGPHQIDHCNMDSFKPQIAVTRIPSGSAACSDVREIINQSFAAFERGEIATCRDCAMVQEQYIVSRGYPRHYKSVAFYQESCADCLSHCTYCCVGGNSRNASAVRMSSLESYGRFIDNVLSLDRLDDDFTCALDMSEREYDRKIALVVDSIQRAGLSPLVYKVNSCLLVYSKSLAELMRRGMVYVIWSLDAGTRETYRRIKQIDAFDKTCDNVRRYIRQDAFGGRFIVAKYLIVRGVNDNAAEFDAFLRMVAELGLCFVSLSFDFRVDPNERDLRFIQSCYEKIIKAGLQLTYKNNSAAVTKALNMNNILDQSI